MAHLSLRVDDELIDELDAEADERGVSRSDYVRNTLENRHRADELEARLDDLRRQLREANSQRDDVDEIVEYAQKEKEVAERREERRDAPLWRRMRWYVFGRD